MGIPSYAQFNLSPSPSITGVRKLTCPLLLITVILMSCNAGLIDSSNTGAIRATNIGLTGRADAIAWVDRQQMAVLIDTGMVFNPDGTATFQPKVALVDMTSGSLLRVYSDPKFKIYHIRSFQVLPDQNVGYIFEPPSLGTNTGPVTIQELNIATGSAKDLYTDPSIAWLGTFAYSGNMSELILVDVNGLYLYSTLYRRDANGQSQNLTQGFVRADFPAWSSSNNLVTFLGTKSYQGRNQLEGMLDYPWRVYIYDPKNQSTRELPIDIVDPSELKWSPNGMALAFAGIYHGIPGVWIVSGFNPGETPIITRVVAQMATFDFSPDGKSLAYVEMASSKNNGAIYVVDLTKLEP